ncbi:MAG: APHP domain-containing protein, partial [Planctomycetota bacterium]
YVLLNNLYQGVANREVELVAELVPLAITDVSDDVGGDGRWVTLTIEGTQVDEDAIVRLIRPGYAEAEPQRYEVRNRSRVRAVFDLTGMPHGLYDVEVINPDGSKATLPYRYTIERRIEPDVSVGLGGPRVINPGETGRFGVSVQNITNVNAPYVQLEFGLPELGENSALFDFDYVQFRSNFRGGPVNADGVQTSAVAFATLESEVNVDGRIRSPGYLYDLAPQDFVGFNFTAATYPGLLPLIDPEANFSQLRDTIYARYPQFEGLLDGGPDGLDQILPGLTETWRAIHERQQAYEFPDCSVVAFPFHVYASATALTHEEYVALQSAEAESIRLAILQDDTADETLQALASESDAWRQLYLESLRQAGLLREATDAPPPIETPVTASVLAVLAAGIVSGPAGEIASRHLPSFFDQLRRWYGHTDGRPGENGLPDLSVFDLGLSNETHTIGFNVYVPFGECTLLPELSGNRQAIDYEAYLRGEATPARVRIDGPLVEAQSGGDAFLPAQTPLPFTVHFDNQSGDESGSAEVRVTVPLGDSLDARSFELGDLQVGELTVSVPSGVSQLQQDFDFTSDRGFIFRVSAGVDIDAGVATWLMQAIDPATGLLSNNPDHVLLPSGSLTGEGSGLVSFRATVHPDSQTGDAIEPRAVVAIQGSPAIEGVGDAYRVDAEAPTTTLMLETIEAVPGEDAVLRLTWESMEPNGGSGVSHATVYVAEDGGDFRIHQRQVTLTSLDFIATEGTVYEFLVLASDAAGNTEPGRFDAQSTHYAAYPSRPSASDPGRRIDDDPTGTLFGSTPDLGDTTAATPPEVPSTPSTNPLLDQVRHATPSIVVRPALEASESGYETVFNPFRGEAVALDLP